MKSSFLSAVIRANEEIAEKLDGAYDESYFAKSSVGAGGDISSGIGL